MTPTPTPPTIDRRPIVPQRGSWREERPVLGLIWTILWGVTLIALVALLIAGMPGGKP